MSNLFASFFSPVVLFAVKAREELIQQELARARFFEIVSYILVGVGLSMMLVGILLSYILKSRKKARKKAAEEESQQEP